GQGLPRPADARRLGQLRAGFGEPEPARLRRAARPRRLQHRRHHVLGERLAAAAVPRHRGADARRGGPQPPPGRPAPPAVARASAEALARLNEARRGLYPGEPDLEARIRNYELAARMQLHADKLLDLSRESRVTRRLYGVDDPVTANFGTRCLMARRLVE